MSAAENELRQCRENFRYATQLVEQSERGGEMDVAQVMKLVTSIAERLSELAQGSIPKPAAAEGSCVQGDATPNGSSPNALGVSLRGQNYVVSDAQRRNAGRLLAEVQLLQTQVSRQQRKAQRAALHTSQVEELLGSHGAGARNDYGEMEHLTNEQQRLQHARRKVQMMNAESLEVLKALQAQGRQLSGVGEKLGDFVESLGVSNTTILQIVRRNQLDAWLVYGGIAFFLFLMWNIW